MINCWEGEVEDWVMGVEEGWVIVEGSSGCLKIDDGVWTKFEIVVKIDCLAGVFGVSGSGVSGSRVLLSERHAL